MIYYDDILMQQISKMMLYPEPECDWEYIIPNSVRLCFVTRITKEIILSTCYMAAMIRYSCLKYLY